MEIPITEIITIEHQVAWLPWAVQYFLLIGMSYSATLMTLPGLVLNKSNYVALARIALLIAVVTALAGSISLLADLHQPGRFWHFYAYPSPASWMWIGSIILPFYITAVLVFAWLVYRPQLIHLGQQSGSMALFARLSTLGQWHKPELIKIVGICAALLGLLIALYTGAEVMIVKARPLWHTYALPIALLISAMTGAAGLAHIINRLNSNNAAVARQLNSIIVVATVFSILVGSMWFLSGALGYSVSAGRALSLLQTDTHWQMTLLTEGLVMFLLVFFARYSNKNNKLNSAWLIGLLAIYSAWMFRWMIFIDVQRVPKYGAGIYSYGLPIGHEGLIGIVGTFGLVVFLFISLSTILPWKLEK